MNLMPLCTALIAVITLGEPIHGYHLLGGGLILTGSAKEKPQVAQVVAVGPGGVVDGKEVKMTVKVGDKVLTSKYSGTEVKVDGEECTIVRQADILAIVE